MTTTATKEVSVAVDPGEAGRLVLPELELPAAEAVLGEVQPLGDHARDLIRFMQQVAPRLRAELEDEIQSCPRIAPQAAYRLGAVDSASRTKELAGRSIFLAVAFKTSATQHEASAVAREELDASHDVDAVARLVRDTIESRLLAPAELGDDQLMILDNSYVSLAENAARAWLALDRCESGLTRQAFARYCHEHLAVDGTFVELLSNARVIALPKVAEARSLTRELFERVGLAADEREGLAARAQRDRVLLRLVLRPGEYLPPRDILGGGDRTAAAQRDRFFHRAEFPAREALLDLYGVGRGLDEPYGLDVVYFRPRRPDGAEDGPVLRVELHRQVARNRLALERVLGTLELHNDGEHSEPMPQLLADQLAKTSVASILDALVEASVIGLLEEFSAASDESSLNVIRWLHEEARA